MLTTLATNALFHADVLFLAVALGLVWLWLVYTIVEGR